MRVVLVPGEVFTPALLTGMVKGRQALAYGVVAFYFIVLMAVAAGAREGQIVRFGRPTSHRGDHVFDRERLCRDGERAAAVLTSPCSTALDRLAQPSRNAFRQRQEP